ncbi:MAG: 50S ribosomal protein L18e [Nanoarchaeota archaeon]|nr:50S ribosomal protein L18e [Nanoarchaeota archaeon]
MENKISKTKIEKRLRTKTNSELVGTIIKLKKTNPEIAKILAMPKKKWIAINLDLIDKKSKEGDKVLVPGKVLSSGNLTKKIKIVAWSISKNAAEKIKQAKSEFVLMQEEMKKNPELKNLNMIKND